MTQYKDKYEDDFAISENDNYDPHESEKCSHMLPRSPQEIYIKRKTLSKIAGKKKKKNEANSESYKYLFIPYQDEFGQFYHAYIEADKKYLEYLINQSNDEFIELVRNFKILHIEPGKYISGKRRKEIGAFFDACRYMINYPQMAVA